MINKYVLIIFGVSMLVFTVFELKKKTIYNLNPLYGSFEINREKDPIKYWFLIFISSIISLTLISIGMLI
ncbi:MAG: hypothetical protein PF569_00710 [Candidatus Woesearchaeota archaeon]|jgi:hypothetical protein|nr:hypothetical protein [Candidatus Woesearchaeota archaeon]